MGELPELHATPTEKMKGWKSWSVSEVRRRTVLALFIIDAQIAQFSGGVPSGRHATNSLAFASKESVFDAKTADDWIAEMSKHAQSPCTFKDVFVTLFNPKRNPILRFTSYLSAHVVLEGLEALIIENRDANGTAVGIPSRYQISQALLNLKQQLTESLPDNTEFMEFLLRWHAVFLDLATDTVPISQKLCAYYDVQESINPRAKSSSLAIDLHTWVASSDARRALLHAIQIQEISQRLPIGRTHTTYMPSSIFAAATVYCATLTATGQDYITPPEPVNWDEVWDCNCRPEDCEVSEDDAVSYSHSSSFILRVEVPLSGSGTRSRDLRSSLHTLQGAIRGISCQWGISEEMSAILLAWESKMSLR